MKKIYLKEWVKPMAELHAVAYVEDVLGLSEDHPKYEKEFEKAFEEFCAEFYNHSLIPHAANPTIPAGRIVFDVFKDDFYQNMKLDNLEQKKELYGNITRSVSMISRVLVEMELGKLKYNYNDVQGSKDEKAVEIHDRVRNRYKRMIFICILMAHIENMFKLKKGEIDSFVDDLLKSEKWRSLQSSKSVKDFADKIKSAVQEDFKSYGPLDNVKKKFGK